ncbi:hypothetical protein B7486_65965, partial [cyanobacterium TDX16]
MLQGADEVDAVRAAEAALVGGDFDGAVDVLERAVATEDDPEALLLLGGMRLMDERYDEARATWERCFRVARTAGRPRTAAMAASQLAEIHAASLGHPSAASGWIERGRRILGPVGPCPEWGYLELAVMACDRLDADDLLASTERALAIAYAEGDSTLEARALCDQG